MSGQSQAARPEGRGTSALNKELGQVELLALLERVSNCEQWEVLKDLEKGRCF